MLARELKRDDLGKEGYVTGIYSNLVSDEIHLLYHRHGKNPEGLYYIKVSLATDNSGSTTMHLVATGTVFHESAFISTADEVVSGFWGLRAYAVGQTTLVAESAIVIATSS